MEEDKVTMNCVVCKKPVEFVLSETDKETGGPTSVVCSKECNDYAMKNPSILFLGPEKVKEMLGLE